MKNQAITKALRLISKDICRKFYIKVASYVYSFRELSYWKFDLVSYQNAIRLHFTFPSTWFIGCHRERNRPLNINFHNPSLHFGKQTCLVAKPLWTTFECLLACLQFFFKMSDLPSHLTASNLYYRERQRQTIKM